MPLRITIAVLCFACSAQADLIGVSGARVETTFERETVKAASKLLRENDLKGAREYLTKRLDGQKNQPHPDIVLAQVLLKLQRGRDARSVLEGLAAKQPDRFDVRMVFCEIALQEGRWFEGILHANQALAERTVPGWDRDHLVRQRRSVTTMKAACCEGSGDWQAAHSIYASQSKVKEPPTAVFSALGRCAFHLKRYDESLRAFGRAYKENDSLPPPNLAIASLFNDAGEVVKAEGYFRKGISADNPSANARTRLAFANWLLARNKPNEIPAMLKQPLKVEGDSSTERQRQLTIALAYRMQHQYPRAKKLLSGLHQSQPTDLAISSHFALVLIEHSDEALRSRALQIAESNVRNHGQSIEAWATLGWVQLKLGDVARAQQSLAKAASGGVISRDVAWYLAELNKQLGNQAESRKLLEAVRTADGPLFADTGVEATKN